uniref:Transmembrane protein n=1 Tax=Spumella elongata TaxID=89044 RepID=A0A7S3HJ51_9STRA|mmetsp:Transcript_55608/g.97444  ORF Transcript_55608/g.97444 Transcript_55608/m.97444 type:complete len:653 (+) Transcript_55608:83-2041(+)
MNYASNLALVSIFLYASLAITCLYFALCFYDYKAGELVGGRYSAPKFAFFSVLCVSAVLDIPLFVGCIAENGPSECEWGTASFWVFWLFHVIATCGYIYAIITPAVLWSDIIHQKDGNFWNSAYPVDSTKLFFRVAFVLFCVNEFVTVVGSVIYQDSSDPQGFNDSIVGSITDCVTTVMTTVITFGCLWSGIELQRYVVSVGLGGSTQRRVLMRMNLTMFLIAASYFYRSLLVLSLYDPMPQQYKDAMHPIRSNFFLWLLGTRWLPAVVCSFGLVNAMRLHGGTGSTHGSHHSQNAVVRASKDGHFHDGDAEDGREHSLYQSLLRSVGAGNGRCSTTTSPQKGPGGRTQSAESYSTADSALESTYSMLSSVDFLDSTSDTSSAYVLSPIGSPDRPKAEQEGSQRNRSTDILSKGQAHHSYAFSGSTVGGYSDKTHVTSKEAERIARKHRKSLQQLQQSTSHHHSGGLSHLSSSSHSSLHHNLLSASAHSTHRHNNNNLNDNNQHGRRHNDATAANIAYSDSPHFLSRAASGSESETDFFAHSRNPSTNNIDHFFTFAAPNLNLSNIGGKERNSLPPPLPSGRVATQSVDLESTLNVTNNSDLNNTSHATEMASSFVSASPPVYRPVNIPDIIARNNSDPPMANEADSDSAKL